MQIQKQETVETKEPEKPVDEEQIYLTEPAKRSSPAIPDEVLDKITEKAINRSRKLAKRTRKAIEKQMNKILLEQLSKLELKFDHLSNFWNLYDLEKRDLEIVREECIAERVALSTLKSGQNQDKEKTLWRNQFAGAQDMLEHV